MNRALVVSQFLKLTLVPALVVVAASLTFSNAAFASDSEPFVCAAVMPCNDDGTVQAPFDEGLCAPTYRSWCLSAQVNHLEDISQACHSQLESKQEVVEKFRKRLRDLRRELRAAARK
jgi:hypothetical protein